MLQRHQLLAEFDALFESDKEKYAPFEDFLRAAQVTSTTFLTSLLAN
jgi:sucrose synthase